MTKKGDIGTALACERVLGSERSDKGRLSN